MFSFGAGRARLIPNGNTGLPTGQGVELGVVGSASVDLKVDLKELRGAYRYPIAVADGKGTASGTVQFMQFWPATLASILGGTLSTGTITTVPTAVIDENGVAATNAYTLVNGATMVAGSEVVSVIVNGAPTFYSRVVSAPVSATTAGVGQGTYSITSAGVITFAIADATVSVRTTYLYYNQTAHSGATPGFADNQSVALKQIGMNTASTFQLTLIGIGKNVYNNATQQFILQLNACLAPSLKIAYKLDDFTDLSLDFWAFIDATGTLGNMYLINPA